MDGSSGAADGGRANLREFDGDAGLTAPQGVGSGAGTVAPRPLAERGIAATLAANVAHGLGHGAVGAAVAAWPAVALVGSYELLMTVIRSSQAVPSGGSGSEGIPDPLQGQAAEVFADHLAADRVPSIRAIRAQLHVGQSQARRLRDYLATGAARQAESPAARATRGRADRTFGPRLRRAAPRVPGQIPASGSIQDHPRRSARVILRLSTSADFGRGDVPLDLQARLGVLAG